MQQGGDAFHKICNYSVTMEWQSSYKDCCEVVVEDDNILNFYQ